MWRDEAGDLLSHPLTDTLFNELSIRECVRKTVDLSKGLGIEDGVVVGMDSP